MDEGGNELLRNRAKGLASLTATAAGGLAIGLLLTTSDIIGPLTRILGVVAASVLLTAAFAFIASSTVQAIPIPMSGPPSRWRYLSPWEVHEKPSEPEPEYDERLVKRIITMTRVGMFASFVAVPVLIFALGMTVSDQTRSRAITINTSQQISVPLCGPLPKTFEARAKETALRADTTEIIVTIPKAICTERTNADIDSLLQRSAVRITLQP